MSVLVDTSVLSLALRRRRPDAVIVRHLVPLLRSGNAAILGLVRQEVLSGIPDERQFLRLREELRSVPDHVVTQEHHEVAASIFNRCRASGVQGSLVDFLLCAASVIDDVPIFTTDTDFALFSRHAPIRLYTPT